MDGFVTTWYVLFLGGSPFRHAPDQPYDRAGVTTDLPLRPGHPHSFSYTASDVDPGTTATVTITVTADPDPPDPGSAISVHVPDLTGSSDNNGRTWTAHVDVDVVDDQGSPVDDATVTGHWDGDAPGSASCAGPTAGGSCKVSRPGIRKRNGSVTFTVDNLTYTLPYVPGDNVVSSVVVNKP